MDRFIIKMPNRILFGQGEIAKLPMEILRFGQNILLLTGEHSFDENEYSRDILTKLEAAEISYQTQRIADEPSVALIDYLCELYCNDIPDVIVAIGGGSVIDTAKALRSMLHETESVRSYISGIGEKALSGKTVPMIAVPTTAGTGSEITNNAVILHHEEPRFKRSLRNDALIPDVAIVDPTLTLSCTLPVTLYSGMDAFCQLIESYTSLDSTPYTDALAIDAFERIAINLPKACTNYADDLDVRTELAYASMISGITLLNSSLTAIHGFASAIGGLYQIPHGNICAAMLFGCTLINMQRLQKYQPNSDATSKFARIGSILSGIEYSYEKHGVLLRAVTENLKKLSQELKIPKLSQLGVRKDDFYQIISEVRLGGNPIELSEADLLEILELSF